MDRRLFALTTYALGLALTLAAGQIQTARATGPCADPRGDTYCPQTPGCVAAGPSADPALQSNAPAAGPNAGISVDPPAASSGTTITVTGQGLGPNRSVWINLAGMTSTTGLSIGAKQLATPDGSTPTTGADGSLSTTLLVPNLPSWTAGSMNICVLNATAQPVCTPFTLQGS